MRLFQFLWCLNGTASRGRRVAHIGLLRNWVYSTKGIAYICI